MSQKSGEASPSNQKIDAIGETASELAHRHLHDKDHETTDEEMKNIQLELGNEGENTTGREVYERSVEANTPLDDTDSDDDGTEKKKTITTPLDILG